MKKLEKTLKSLLMDYAFSRYSLKNSLLETVKEGDVREKLEGLQGWRDKALNQMYKCFCNFLFAVVVHITQGDHEGKGVIISWITPNEVGSSMLLYWADDSKVKKSANSTVVTYKYYDYSSGYIHLIWDLGQTFDSNKTLAHYELNPAKGQTMLFVGDLSYADCYPNHDNNMWDTWGRFIERNAAYQPWIWTAGNHEIDFVPEIGEYEPFKPYKNRYFVPYRAANSTSPLCYAHHYMEGETMRVMYESWFVEYKVDVVFSGHVHAYERSEQISNFRYNVVNGKCTPMSDQSAPVYITIGDGGNQEGLVTEMTEPRPSYSAYREARFGHGTFEIKNKTHAYFTWHRNQDDHAIEADSLWFHNRYWKSSEQQVVASSR
ncbi:hypothetical protein AgCh_009803 [Apium graveolens]